MTCHRFQPHQKKCSRTHFIAKFNFRRIKFYLTWKFGIQNDIKVCMHFRQKGLCAEKFCTATAKNFVWGLAVDMATAWRFLMFCFASILCVNIRRLMNRFVFFKRSVESDFVKRACAYAGGKRALHLAMDWKFFGKVRFSHTETNLREYISTQKLSGRLRRKTRFCSRAS